MIALLEDGDKITIDAVKGIIEVDLSIEEIKKRKKVKEAWELNN